MDKAHDNKICVFGYNFPHWKTQNGLLNLIIENKKPDFVILQNWKKLNTQKSKNRITPKDLYLVHPQQILKKFDIPYVILDHNSEESISILEENKFELGIILGSRILSEFVINKFQKGILNLHPGVLPENRGLNNIQFAILNDLPQGVTSHLIDKNIDRGLLISRKHIKVYQDDTLIDIHIRIQNLEQKMMVEAVNNLIDNCFTPNEKIGFGDYNSPITPRIEKIIKSKFTDYKKKWCK
jgi:phosphoribosylglycinamide formyltransferase-1